MDMPMYHNNSNKARQSKQPLVLTALGTLALAFLFWAFYLKPTPVPIVTKAVVVIKGDSPVTGIVTFTQNVPTGPVTVLGELKGLDPDEFRGFHVHSLGDVTGGCLSTGSHFNPFDQHHGAPEDTARHVGDLGNIKADGQGAANFEFKDELISLNGPLSIVGRAVVVHAGTDDLGKGDNEESLKTGNAGGRAACGVIGLA